MTLLPSGKVLVAGGYEGFGNTIATAEVYDPISQTWEYTFNTMHFARANHTATLLPDGKVLVAGGHDEELASGSYCINNAELYDPVENSWTLITTSQLTHGRFGHTATLLQNGQVLVAGGTIQIGTSFVPTASSDLYNPSDQTWTPTIGDMTNPRERHAATPLVSGMVLVTGGPGQTADSAELYNPVSRTWTPTISMHHARIEHTLTTLFNGSALAAAGHDNTSERYQNFAALSLSWLLPIAGQNQTLGNLSGTISTGSGVTFRPAQNGSQQDAILVLDNNPRRVFQFSRTGVQQGGVAQRIITLQDFSDPEDIHWLGDPANPDYYVISQEENGTSTDAIIDEIVVINIPYAASGDITVDIDNAVRRLQISHDPITGFVSRQNRGIEAVALIGNDFYFTTERDPLEGVSRWNVWKVPNTGTGLSTVTPIKAFSLPELIVNRARDISGMATDGTYLWLLSDEGVFPSGPRGRVLIMTTSGQLIGDYQLPDFTLPAAGTWQQAEGIELFVDPADSKWKILLTGEIGGGTGVDFMLLSAP